MGLVDKLKKLFGSNSKHSKKSHSDESFGERVADAAEEVAEEVAEGEEGEWEAEAEFEEEGEFEEEEF